MDWTYLIVGLVVGAVAAYWMVSKNRTNSTPPQF